MRPIYHFIRFEAVLVLVRRSVSCHQKYKALYFIWYHCESYQSFAERTRLPDLRRPRASRSSACLDLKALLRLSSFFSVTGHLLHALEFCQKKTLVSNDAMRQRVFLICCFPRSSRAASEG